MGKERERIIKDEETAAAGGVARRLCGGAETSALRDKTTPTREFDVRRRQPTNGGRRLAERGALQGG
ncbi:hypothetical protein MRX96_043244 [Rhipicephalus microplus]